MPPRTGTKTKTRVRTSTATTVSRLFLAAAIGAGVLSLANALVPMSGPNTSTPSAIKFSVQSEGTPTAMAPKYGEPVSLMDFTVIANDQDIQVRGMRGEIRSSTDCFVKQSKGTPSFTNIRIVDRDSSAVVEGPVNMESTVATGTRTTGVLRFGSTFTISKYTQRHLSVLADMSVVEDSPGELFSKGTCLVHFGLYRQGIGSLYAVQSARLLDIASETSFPAPAVLNGKALKVVGIPPKSIPTVTMQALPSTTLANGSKDLIKFQVSAGSAGPIAWKQAIFSYTKTSNITLSNFRLRRGTSDFSSDVYSIRDASSTSDLKSGKLGAIDNSGYVVVSFKPGFEETISGIGNVYTLYADVTGAVSPAAVTFKFEQAADSGKIVVGSLSNGALMASFKSGKAYMLKNADVFQIDTAAVADGKPEEAGTFLWSDVSGIPHSPSLGTSGGSRDWRNDALVQDLSRAQNLSL